MATTESLSGICSICHESEKLWAVAACNHPICFRCSTRLRVLHQQNVCPICRTDNVQVLIVRRVHNFAHYNLSEFLLDRKTNILFEDSDIKKAFRTLQEHTCPHCPKDSPPFGNFDHLYSHIKKEHQMYFCDICVQHVKLFTSERKTYSRVDLATHKRKGDADDMSFKGHPNCQICDHRFLDMDELWRHLRKDHFFCHFCDADGEHIYFGAYSDVRHHFQEKHFLCEEDDCKNVQFTNAFRSEMDLKAHSAQLHLKGAKRSQQRMARTIEIDLNYGEPRRLARDSKRKQGSGITSDDYLDLATNPLKGARGKLTQEDDDTARALAASLHEPGAQQAIAPSQPVVDVTSVQDFPSLRGDRAVSQSLAPKALPKPASGISMHDDNEDFPSLSRSIGSDLAASKARPTSVQPLQRAEDFPVLPGSRPTVSAHGWHLPKPQPRPSMSFVNNAAPSRRKEDFPTLGAVEKLASGGQWINKKETKLSAAMKASQEVVNHQVGKSRGNTAHQLKPHSAASQDKSSVAKPADPLSNDSKSKKGKSTAKPAMEESISKVSMESVTHAVTKPSKKTKNKKGASQPISLSASASPAAAWSVCDVVEVKPSATLSASQSQGGPPLSAKITPAEPTLAAAEADTCSTNVTEVKDKSKTGSSKIKETIASPVDIPKLNQVVGPPDAAAKANSLDDLRATLIAEIPNQNNSATSWQSAGVARNVSEEEFPALCASVSFKGMSIGGVKKPPPGLNTPDGRLPPGLLEVLPPDLMNLAATKSSLPPGLLAPDIRLPAGVLCAPDTQLAPWLNAADCSRPPPGLTSVTHISSARPVAHNGVAHNGSHSLGSIANSVLGINISDNQFFAPYAEPINFDQRNRNLAFRIKDLIGNDNDKFHTFKNLSQDYRNGTIDASDFLCNISAILKEDALSEVMPELLALLPDIEKQHNLYKLTTAKLHLSKHTAGWNLAEKKLECCRLCSQLVLPSDSAYHSSQHNLLGKVEEFPCLSKQTQSAAKN